MPGLLSPRCSHGTRRDGCPPGTRGRGRQEKRGGLRGGREGHSPGGCTWRAGRARGVHVSLASPKGLRICRGYRCSRPRWQQRIPVSRSHIGPEGLGCPGSLARCSPSLIQGRDQSHIVGPTPATQCECLDPPALQPSFWTPSFAARSLDLRLCCPVPGPPQLCSLAPDPPPALQWKLGRCFAWRQSSPCDLLAPPPARPASCSLCLGRTP